MLANIVELFVHSDEDCFNSFPGMPIFCVQLLLRKLSLGFEGSFKRLAADGVLKIGCFRTQIMVMIRITNPMLIPGMVIKKIR